MKNEWDTKILERWLNIRTNETPQKLKSGFQTLLLNNPNRQFLSSKSFNGEIIGPSTYVGISRQCVRRLIPLRLQCDKSNFKGKRNYDGWIIRKKNILM